MNPHRINLATTPARAGKDNLKQLLAACLLLGTASIAHGQWSASGNNLRYETPENWVGGVINDTFTGTLGWSNNWNVNIGSRTLPGNFTYHNGDAVNASFTPDGGATWTFTSPRPTFSVEAGDPAWGQILTMGAASRAFTIDFSDNDAVFEISPGLATYIGASGKYDTLALQAVINHAGSITKTGAGKLTLDRQVNITNGGALNVLNGVVRLQSNANNGNAAALRGASAINVTGRGSALDIGPGASGVNFLEATTSVHLNGGALAFGLSANDTQQVGSVTLEGGRSVLGNYRVEGSSPSALVLSSLTRKNAATVNIALSSTGNGALNSIKISGDDSGILASLVGGGGGAGSTNISILPWMTGSLFGHNGEFLNTQDDSMWSSASFVTYSHADGFRVLANEEFYVADSTNLFSNAGNTDNVTVNLGALTVSADKTVNSLRFNTGSTITIGAGKTLTVSSGAMNGQSVAYTIDGASGKLDSGSNPLIFTGRNRATINAGITNSITDPTAAGLIIAQVGSGVTLNGTNTYGGATIIQGNLTVGSSGALPSATTVQVQKSGTLALGNSITASIQRLTGSGMISFNSGNLSSQINIGGGTGAGNTITVNAGGILAPGYGDAVDSLIFGNNARNLTLNEGGEFHFTLAGANEVSMIRNINTAGANTLTINGGTLYLTFLDGYDPAEGSSWTLTSGFNATEGFASNLDIVDLTYGYSYAASFVDDNLVLTLSIPEPSTYIMAFGGLLLLGWNLRRRLG